MRMSGKSVALVLGAFLVMVPWLWGLAQSGETEAEGFIALRPDVIRPEQEDEISRVWITGGVDEPGVYVVRNTFPPGVNTRPHFHSEDRYVTVIEGTWWVALGEDAEVYNPEKMVPMEAGSFVKHPAGGIHYDGAKDEAVVVQIIGMGPVTTTQVDPGPNPE